MISLPVISDKVTVQITQNIPPNTVKSYYVDPRYMSGRLLYIQRLSAYMLSNKFITKLFSSNICYCLGIMNDRKSIIL